MDLSDARKTDVIIRKTEAGIIIEGLSKSLCKELEKELENEGSFATFVHTKPLKLCVDFSEDLYDKDEVIRIIRFYLSITKNLSVTVNN